MGNRHAKTRYTLQEARSHYNNTVRYNTVIINSLVQSKSVIGSSMVLLVDYHTKHLDWISIPVMEWNKEVIEGKVSTSLLS